MSAELGTIAMNGVETPVVYEQDSRLPLVSLQLVFRNSGSLTDAKPGIAKLSGKLLGEGTKSMGSIAFAEALEGRAVSLNAHAGAETFVISLSALKSEWSFAVDRLLELLADPNYSDEAFSKVQAQAIGTLSQKQSDFDYVAENGLKSLLFEGTPREHPFDGTIQSLKDITLDDLKAHISTKVGRENLVAVVGGDISEHEAMGMIEQILEMLNRISVDEIAYTPVRKEPKERFKEAKTEQAYIYFGSPYDLPYNSDKSHLSKVAAYVLGSSGFGSRLMEEIRVKRGLAYSAYANFSISRTASYFSGHLQTKLDSANEAKKVVKELLSDFVANGITEEELESAKQFLQGSEPLRTETLQQRLGRAFNEFYSDRELGYGKRELELISSIKLDEINSFIRQHQKISKLSFFTVINSMSK